MVKNKTEHSRELGLGFSLPDYPVSGSDKAHGDDKYTSEKSKILRSMHMNINHSWTFWQKEYQRAREDVKFAYEEQWDEAAKAQRLLEQKPVLSPTLIPQYIHRIAGVARQSKFSIHVQQVGGPEDAAVKVGSGEMISLAEVMEGLIRDIETKSKATLKYSRALQHSVEGGIGWLRVRICAGPYDPFNSEIKIEHVRDRQSVILDHLAEEPLLTDANYGWISKWMDYDDFKNKWGHKERTEWMVAKDLTGDATPGFYKADRFFSENAIRVGEYYWKEPVTKTAVLLVNEELSDEIQLYEGETDDVVFEEFEKLGYKEEQRIKHETYDVKCVLCTGDTILEGPFTWPGKTIPIVPVIGRQVDDGADNTSYYSLHRFCHDSQRMFSWLSSRAIERVAKAPDAVWIVDMDTIAGLEDKWKQTNNASMLPFRADQDKPPPERVAGAEIPAAEIQLLQVMHNSLMQAIGLTDSSLGRKSNETSGAAIQQRQMAGEYGSLEFIDNLSHAIATIGDIICDIIPKVYTGSKIKRLIMADDTQVQVILNQKIKDPDTETEHTYNQIGLARFATTSVAGPAFATQRQEMMEMMMELGKTNPETIGLAFDLIVKAMDFPGGEALVKRLKASLPRHILTPEELKTLPEPQPSPEQELEKLQLETEQMKAQAVGQTAQADMAKAQASQMQAQADMAKAEAMNTQAQADLQKAQVELQKTQLEVVSSENKVRVGELQVDEKQAMLQQEQLEIEKTRLELKIKEKELQENKEADSKIQPAVKKAMAEQKSSDMAKERSKSKKAT